MRLTPRPAARSPRGFEGPLSPHSWPRSGLVGIRTVTGLDLVKGALVLAFVERLRDPSLSRSSYESNEQIAETTLSGAPGRPQGPISCRGNWTIGVSLVSSLETSDGAIH